MELEGLLPLCCVVAGGVAMASSVGIRVGIVEEQQ